VTQAKVVLSEWIKLRSLRSTYFTLLAAVALMVGFGYLFSWGVESHWAQQSAAERATFDPTLTSLRGMYLAQLAVGVLGVLVVTGEYSTGMIRATLAAVPKRLPVLWSKTAVFGGVALVTMVIAALVSFLGGQAILSTQHIQTTLSEPGVLRAVIGTGMYLAVVGVLGVALGTILRNTAGAIATLFGVLLVLPILGALLPSSWRTHITPYLPSNAGQAIMNVVHSSNDMAPWTGFALFCAYTAGALALAAVVLKRRDA
jgi:ABC-type transport system involved in multi-copper enzyme maturation permease subunit